MTHPNSLKNLRPYVKGQSGNTAHNRLSEDLRSIKSLTPLEVLRTISKWARMTKLELEAEYANPKTSILERAIARIFQESIKQGDYAKLSFLLDRAIGRAPVVVDDEETVDARQDLAKLSMGELLTFVRENLPEQPI